MLRIVIPTFNRSAKLERVLDWYRAEKLDASIVILDASDDAAHQNANRLAVEAFGQQATRVDALGQNDILERLRTYLVSIDDDIVVIGNDEDAFLPEFMVAAAAFLQANRDYVLVTGRYVTSARGLGPLRRISYWSDTFLGMDVDDAEPAHRIVNFQRMNSGGVPPLFWSVRRREVFVSSCTLAREMKHASTHELIDQINTCASGKIGVRAEPMLLRDESKVAYKKFHNRDEGRLYIGAADLDAVDAVTARDFDNATAAAVRIVTSWFRARDAVDSFHSRQFSRSYCRFQPLEQLNSRRLRWLAVAIRGCCSAGILLSQIFAFCYFSLVMARNGRGARFRRMTRNIAVNRTGSRQ